MNWRNMGVRVLVSALMICHAGASFLYRPWTEAEWIENMDRIVIGTVELKGDQSIITVEKVLKGAAEPKIVIDSRKPHHGDLHDYEKTDKVLWMDANPGKYKSSSLSPAAFSYIKEGSPRWLLYHALIDPAPLVRDKVFERNSDALQVLGYVFDPLKVSSSDAPMVAERLMHYDMIYESLPWTHADVLDLKCRVVQGDPDRIQVDFLDAEGEIVKMIRHGIESLPFDHMESPVPSRFSLRIDARRIESIDSLSFEEAAGHLRRHVRMGLADIPSKDQRDSDQDRRAFHQMIYVTLRALKRMRDMDSVPDVVLLAVSDNDQSRVAFDFLNSAKDPRSVEPMCKLLAENAPNYPKKSWLSNGAAQVLGRIGDPVAVSAMEVGARYGVETVHYRLDQIGRVETMGAIIESDNDRAFTGAASGTLLRMVGRSNLEVEPWMESKVQIEKYRKDDVWVQWRKWWQAHKHEVKLVRTLDEAQRARWAAQSKVELKTTADGKKHAWKYVLGAVGLLILWFVYHARRKPA